MRIKFILIFIFGYYVSSNAQNFTEILGRPTDKSISINVVFDTSADAYFEYGISSGHYTNQTQTSSTAPDEPIVAVMDGLQPNTRYFYRTRYRKSGGINFLASTEHTFITQRAKGSSFTFTVEADPHPYDKKGYIPLWNMCMQNQLSEQPDFMFDLGDTFGDDHLVSTITTDQVKQLILNNRPVFGQICHSVPLFFCLGNHEGESGYYLLQNPPANMAVYETLWRKKYYPNPEPDDFYSGNNVEESFGMGKPQDYYAFEWGDVLFVVLDAYRFYTANAKPRNWDWTIGQQQYNWLKQTIENSKATFKLVFIHHLLGEARGAATIAKLNEWGGYDKNGTWQFNAQRPGWDLPIHQLLLKNNVNAVIQGHDHLFALENVDGMIYQTTPMPSDSSYVIGVTDNGDAFTGKIIKGAGHLKFNVNPDSIKVDYISAVLPEDESDTLKNNQTVYSYSIKKNVVNGISAVTLNNQSNNFRIFPNPTDGKELNIFFKKATGKISTSIYGVDGKLMYHSNINQNFSENQSFCIENIREFLSKGVYFVTLNDENQLFGTQKIIVK